MSDYEASASPSADGRPWSRRWLPWVALVAGSAVVLAVLLWPTATRSADRVDVVVVGDGFVHEARQALERRLRERSGRRHPGRGVGLALRGARQDLLDAVDRDHPTVVVLSFRKAEPACDGVPAGADPTSAVYDQVLAEVGDARVVLSVQPGPPGAEGQDQPVQDTYQALHAARRASVADPSTLLGGTDAPAAMRCQWWDVCDPSGTVAVRQGDGGPLTEAGDQRFARVIVGVIP